MTEKKEKNKGGRPPLSDLPQISERKEVMRRELVNVLKPYYRAAIAEIAILGGIRKRKKGDVEISAVSEEGSNTESSKEEKISANVRLTACKTLAEAYESSLKEVYLKDDTTPSKKELDAEPKPKATVHSISFSVPSKQ
jgi:hypothetical protein